MTEDDAKMVKEIRDTLAAALPLPQPIATEEGLKAIMAHATIDAKKAEWLRRLCSIAERLKRVLDCCCQHGGRAVAAVDAIQKQAAVAREAALVVGELVEATYWPAGDAQ